MRSAGPEEDDRKKTSSGREFSTVAASISAFTAIPLRDNRETRDRSGNGPSTLASVGLWYWLGLALGLGVALGIVFAAALSQLRAGIVLACAGAATAGCAIGLVWLGPAAAAAFAIGGVIGAFAAGELSRATLTRGGTRAASALLLVLGALALGALALVPVLGYLEGAVVLVLGSRLRRRSGRRFAGLRVLARD